MSLINNQILGPSSYEIIRERLAEILYTELLNQYDYTGDDEVNIPRIWIERLVDFNASELPAINVQVVKVDLDNHSQLGSDGTGQYWIDIHTKASKRGIEDGGYLAQKHMQKLAGICRQIIEHSNYKTLAFEAPFIMNRRVLEIRFVTNKTEDTLSIATGRLLVSVRAPEVNGVFVPRNIAEWVTVVKLHDSEAGYKWVGQPGEGFDLSLDSSF